MTLIWKKGRAEVRMGRRRGRKGEEELTVAPSIPWQTMESQPAATWTNHMGCSLPSLLALTVSVRVIRLSPAGSIEMSNAALSLMLSSAMVEIRFGWCCMGGKRRSKG